jgi:hypothetical protein
LQKKKKRNKRKNQQKKCYTHCNYTSHDVSECQKLKVQKEKEVKAVITTLATVSTPLPPQLLHLPLKVAVASSHNEKVFLY